MPLLFLRLFFPFFLFFFSSLSVSPSSMLRLYGSLFSFFFVHDS